MSNLDATDHAILALLQGDGRMTHAAIAEEIHLSPSACLRRVRRLESAGIISGYHARLDRALLGLGATVFVEISLDGQQEHQLDEFEAAAREVPEILACHLMAGDADYLLQIVATDVADYERVHRTAMARLPHVAKVRTNFVLRSVIDRAPIEARR